MLIRVAIAVFGVIQAVLTLRLLLPFIDLPPALAQFEPTILTVSDALIAPFSAFTSLLGVGSGLGGSGTTGGSFLEQLDAPVVVALVGWSLIELVGLAILRIFTRSEGS